MSKHILPAQAVSRATFSALSHVSKETTVSPVSDSSEAGWAIQTFVLATLDMMDAAVAVVDLGVYDVLLPGEQVKRITFDPEIAQERADCAMVTFGTPFLEAVIAAAKSRGQQQVRRIEARSELPQNVDGKLCTLVHFVKCKPPRPTRTWKEESFLLLCHFQVTFHADEVVEQMISVLIDLHSLADATHLLTALESHWFTADPTAAAAVAATDTYVGDLSTPQSISSSFRLKDGLARAALAVQPEIQKRIASIRSQNRLQLQDELEKSHHYYETTLNKLRKQLSGTMDAAKKERVRQKIEATERDRGHRREDISRAYDVSCDMRLDQAILYRVPVACVEAEIQQRTDFYPYVFRYYPWASTWSPITCPVCHELATRLERGDDSWHCGCEKPLAGLSPSPHNA